MSAFIDNIEMINGGVLLADLDDALTELVKNVREAKKAGSITLTINVRPTTARTVAVTAKHAVKAPKPAEIETLFFTTEHGELLTEDPLQHKLDLKPAPSDVPLGTLRSIAP